MNPKEKAANKEAFRRMGLTEKLDYIRTYYWGPILLAVVGLVILVTILHHHFTKKNQILFIANVNVSTGEALEKVLHQDYLLSRGVDSQKNEILFYRNLYLSNNPSLQNHEMAYASKLKMLAVINGKKLDIALMNREAYDILSGSGYLLDLTLLSDRDDSLFRAMEPMITENVVIIEDNEIEVNLNEADSYMAVTKDVPNGIDLTKIPAVRDAGFSDSVYFGIIANTPRLQECCEYLKYVFSLDQVGA